MAHGTPIGQRDFHEMGSLFHCNKHVVENGRDDPYKIFCEINPDLCFDNCRIIDKRYTKEDLMPPEIEKEGADQDPIM